MPPDPPRRVVNPSKFVLGTPLSLQSATLCELMHAHVLYIATPPNVFVHMRE